MYALNHSIDSKDIVNFHEAAELCPAVLSAASREDTDAGRGAHLPLPHGVWASRNELTLFSQQVVQWNIPMCSTWRAKVFLACNSAVRFVVVREDLLDWSVSWRNVMTDKCYFRLRDNWILRPLLILSNYYYFSNPSVSTAKYTTLSACRSSSPSNVGLRCFSLWWCELPLYRRSTQLLKFVLYFLGLCYAWRCPNKDKQQIIRPQPLSATWSKGERELGA